MVSLLLPVIYLAFISLGLPDALLGAGWQYGTGKHDKGDYFSHQNSLSFNLV